jgi:hypothetical protein
MYQFRKAPTANKTAKLEKCSGSDERRSGELLFAGHGLGPAHEALVLVLQRAHHGGHVALLLLGLLLGGLLEPDFKIGKIVSRR